MIFKLHYFCLTSGACAIGILLGVFMEAYTDASSLEIGALLMVMPFTGIIFKPIICSMADREQAHQKYLLACLTTVVVSYSPFIVIPYLGVHQEHPRVCWYVLFVSKVIGDIAFGGMVSIGDALAINYANRIGTEFSVYRIWGTVGWMSFGLIIGQINEVSFIPKYVPGFMVLIGSTFLNLIVIWLWPKEYFVMVPVDLKAENEKEQQEREQHQQSSKKESAMLKSLMPKEVVLAHMKSKLRTLVCMGSDEYEKKYAKTAALSIIQHQPKSDPQVEVENGCAANTAVEPPAAETPIDKGTQLKILATLLRKDPRIILYLVFFTFAGVGISALSFFIIGLSNICHDQGACQFSELTGYLQFSMAATETVFFYNVKHVRTALGRINMCVLCMALIAAKNLFYGTIFYTLNPYYSILAEMTTGVAYCINLTLCVEMGHLFANEVELILPELMAKNVIKENSPAAVQRLNLSLAATMQALTNMASDGLGRGFGALIYGLLLELYTFETLWLIIGVSATICGLTTLAIKVFDVVFKPNLGLDVRAKLKQEQAEQQQGSTQNEITC